MARPKKIKWDKVEKLYSSLPTKVVAKKTGVNYNTVRSIAARSGLKKDNRFWSEKEKKNLLKYYEYGIAFVLEKLPNRSKWAIINKYRELKKNR